MTSKIIVTGSLNGHFKAVFPILAKLHAKNAFSVAISVGNFFAPEDSEAETANQELHELLSGKISSPIPIYFTVGDRKLPKAVIDKLEVNAGELCENLFFLPKTIKTSEGIKIVSLGGIETPELDGQKDDGSSVKYRPTFSPREAKVLKGANSSDLLITYQWPALIRSGSNVKLPLNGGEDQGAFSLANLCAALKPRYHIACSDTAFFEREPFYHPQDINNPDIATRLTRFISIASYGNVEKQKWLYAFSLDPKASSSANIPDTATPSPLIDTSRSQKRRRLPDQAETYAKFQGHGDQFRQSKRRTHSKPATECFFCLSNSNLATHLIVSIGNESYLTTSKGPLTTSSTFDSFNFPFHILIIPFAHTPTLGTVDSSIRVPTFAEMTRYREALQSMLRQKASNSLGAVTFEISRSRGVHEHWQFLPIPADLIKRGLVEAAFKTGAEASGYMSKFEQRDIGDGSQEAGEFFRVWIWRPLSKRSSDGGDDGDDKAQVSSSEEVSLVLKLEPNSNFDPQFGRWVMAKLMGLEERTLWKECEQGQSEETKDAEAFKAAFKEWDFSLSE